MLHLRQDHLVRLRHARRRRPGERAAPAAVHLPLTWPPAAPPAPEAPDPPPRRARGLGRAVLRL